MSHLPNIRSHTLDNGKVAEVVKALLPLVEKLALAKPHWTFKPITNLADKVNAFTVFHGDARLGRIETVRTWRKDEYVSVFLIANDRIAKERTRGNCVETANLNTAFHIVCKKFHRNTPEETLEAVTKAANNVMHKLHDANVENYATTRRVIFGPMFIDFIQDNIDLVKKYFLDRGEIVVVNNINDLKTLYDAMVVSSEFAKDLRAGDKYIVVPYEGKYLVKHLDTVQLYDDTTLPEHLKQNVGLLKLVDKNTFIPNVGLKVYTEAFIVNGETK